MREHEDKVDVNCVYSFHNPELSIPARVLVKFYDGEIMTCLDCSDLKSKYIMSVDFFMHLEPMLITRLSKPKILSISKV